MHRKELPRIYELRDLIQNPTSQNAYYHGFDETFSAWPQKRKQFCELEEELQWLDDEAWIYFKKRIAPLLTAKDAKRGWQQLFDKLNEAKAYKYLKRAGYRNPRFICESSVSGQQTPDLEADGVLCEVKTINISKEEATRRQNGGVISVSDRLGEEFFKKLTSKLEQAKGQIAAYCEDAAIKKLVYVVVNFDDLLHEYADRYQQQIRQYLTDNPTSGIEIELDIKPAFYAAMS